MWVQRISLVLNIVEMFSYQVPETKHVLLSVKPISYWSKHWVVENFSPFWTAFREVLWFISSSLAVSGSPHVWTFLDPHLGGLGSYEMSPVRRHLCICLMVSVLTGMWCCIVSWTLCKWCLCMHWFLRFECMQIRSCAKGMLTLYGLLAAEMLTNVTWSSHIPYE